MAATTATNIVTQPIFNKIFHGQGATNATKFVGNVLSFAVPVSAGVGLTTAAGFSLSAKAGVGVVLAAEIGLPIAITALLISVVVAAALTGAVSSATTRTQ
jgi:hypothetical protein